MSKKYMSWGEANRIAPLSEMTNLPIMIRQWAFSNFEGKLLTLMESMGLPEKQENAIKSYLRQELWEFVRSGLIVPDETDLELEPNVGCNDCGTALEDGNFPKKYSLLKTEKKLKS